MNLNPNLNLNLNLNLKTLIGKLNDTPRLAATRAASICVALGQYEVEAEQLFLALRCGADRAPVRRQHRDAGGGPAS